MLTQVANCEIFANIPVWNGKHRPAWQISWAPSPRSDESLTLDGRLMRIHRSQALWRGPSCRPRVVGGTHTSPLTKCLFSRNDGPSAYSRRSELGWRYGRGEL